MIQEKFSDSLVSALQIVYPEISWLIWQFQHLPRYLSLYLMSCHVTSCNVKAKACHRGFWSIVENQRNYVNALMNELNMEKLEDWYSVKSEEISSEHPPLQKILESYYHGSLLKLLKAVYPQHKWYSWRFPDMAAAPRTQVLLEITLCFFQYY
jgi:hypothetical protein